jgi:hypothetical protein
MLATLTKMLTKNVGHAPKKVDEKMLTSVPKNVDEKCSQHFLKNVDRKNINNCSKIINKNEKKSKRVSIRGTNWRPLCAL